MSAPDEAPVRAGHGRLHARIALLAGAVNAGLLLLAIVGALWFAYRMVLREAAEHIKSETEQSYKRVDDLMRTVTVTCAGISDAVVKSQLPPAQLIPALRAMVQATPGATGATLIVEPSEPGEAPFARYISAQGASHDRDHIRDDFGYREKPWFQRTLSSPGGWWSVPYFSETAGGVWTLTYNLPLRAGGRGAATRGMVSMDITLDEMRRRAHGPGLPAGWQHAIIAPDGEIAIHSEPGVALQYDLPGYIEAFGRSDLASIVEPLRQRRSLHFSHTDPRDGERYFTAIVTNPQSGGSTMLSVPYALILGRFYRVMALVIGCGLAAALATLLVVWKLTHRISAPVEDLTRSAMRLDGGDYGHPVPHGGRRDEIGQLARTLDRARTSIRRQLEEIRELAAAQQKLESELSIARDIQMSMVPAPRRFCVRGGLSLQIHAMLEPAKAVGGDFYGFHEESGGVVWFGIGDVSDKGMPAALFMARSDTVLQTATRTAATPSEVLATASRGLVEGNDTCMFVTVLVGRIDLASGDCLLASAGHDTPLLLRADGRIERLGFDTGPALGIEACDDFPLWRGRLGPGDGLVAWTDGVTEAFDEHDEAFGETRLHDTLAGAVDAETACTVLMKAVHDFAGSAPQSDDITILALHCASAGSHA